MGFQLRSGISFCEVSDRLLFLDVVADRYFCLQPGAEHAFRNMVSGADLDDSDARELDGMIRAGTLLQTRDHRTPTPLRGTRHASLSMLDSVEGQELSVSSGAICGALIAIFIARFSLQHRRLHATLRAIDLRKIPWPRSGQVDLEAVQAAATAFEATSRFVRSHDKCLSRSIALARYLAARELPADLMIGVKLRPFAAHAWVQSGRWLVNDRIDMVRDYTPILVV
ncbi:lasso peptide biosynthesis B2 protein [Novosphingobium terrae]|uniref:lasso peptide biosynthesis B2 protein n=1 Tax=Novosphingobium terrae TaxID=2726189 RepID=UPI00197DC65C|nr:lasso peptide biosynthesis B2 protein [Novosphingobium terrae]